MDNRQKHKVTLKFLEEKFKNLWDLSLGKGFLDGCLGMIHKRRKLMNQISSKLKPFSGKILLKQWKDQAEPGRKYLQTGSVFQGRHNKSPETGGLKTTDTYFLTILEVRNLISRCQWLSLKAGSEGFFLASSYLVVVPGNPWHSWAVNVSLESQLPLSPCILPMRLCPNFLLIRMSAIQLGPIVIQYDLILTCLYRQRPSFQIRSHSQASGFKICTYLFGEHN